MSRCGTVSPANPAGLALPLMVIQFLVYGALWLAEE